MITTGSITGLICTTRKSCTLGNHQATNGSLLLLLTLLPILHYHYRVLGVYIVQRFQSVYLSIKEAIPSRPLYDQWEDLKHALCVCIFDSSL